MTLSQELAWRGFTNQTTFKHVSALDTKPLAFYWGVDPSADSMTVGNLAIAMMVRHFIAHGHHAVLLVGGATGLIGDPDGKDEERELKSLKEIARNKRAIVGQYKRLFAGQRFTVVDNYDWFERMHYLTFLRDVGKHVPMRQMLGRDFVQKRLSDEGNGISYAEFSYSLIQGYDFLHLYRTRGVTLQVCGADQWGNSIAGVELIRRITAGEAHVWSAPLVVNAASGAKFGKTEAGAVWLDEQKTSPFQFYQFWFNVDDQSVESYLKLYTLKSKGEITDVMRSFELHPGKRHAQKVLAYDVTKLVHGEQKAAVVRKASEVLFGERTSSELDKKNLEVLKAELPVVKAKPSETAASLLERAGLASSKSEAQRLIAQAAIEVNGAKLARTSTLPLHRGANVVKRGKNSFAIVEY